jgi:hypothetical protein
MEKFRIFVFSHTPLSGELQDINGAFLRTAAMVNALKDFGFDVKFISIGRHASHDIQIRSGRHPLLGYAYYAEDIEFAQVIMIKNALTGIQKNDVIILDQPFSWGIVREFVGNHRVIYASHNQESKVAEQISRLFNFESNFSAAAKRVLEIEGDLISRSQFTVSVCTADADEFDTQSRAPSLVVPNTIEKIPETSVLKSRKSSDWVFVSSNWPLNWLGLIDMIEPSQFLQAGLSLKIVGSAGQGLKDDPRGRDWIKRMKGHVEILGVSTEEDLNKILSSAYGTINPILMGGGSNFKLVQAAGYRHRIVSTIFGARGDLHIENLYVAKNRLEFNSLLSNTSTLLPANIGKFKAPKIYDWKTFAFLLAKT